MAFGSPTLVAMNAGAPTSGESLFAQLESWWQQAGGDAATAPIAAAIAMAEGALSDPFGINPDSSGTQSAGLWQINSANWPNLEKAGIISSPQDLTDPVKNAAAAVYISGNGKNWNPWTTYRTGAYAKYLGDTAPPGLPAPPPVPGQPNQPGTVPQLHGGALDLPGQLQGLLGNALSPILGANLAGGTQGDPWLTIGAVFVGAVLVLVGVVWLAGYEVTASGVARSAVKATAGRGATAALAALA